MLWTEYREIETVPTMMWGTGWREIGAPCDVADDDVACDNNGCEEGW